MNQTTQGKFKWGTATDKRKYPGYIVFDDEGTVWSYGLSKSDAWWEAKVQNERLVQPPKEGKI